MSDLVERLAERIYETMRFDREDTTTVWQPRGNSHAQNKARACANSVLKMVDDERWRYDFDNVPELERLILCIEYPNVVDHYPSTMVVTTAIFCEGTWLYDGNYVEHVAGKPIAWQPFPDPLPIKLDKVSLEKP